MNGREVWAFILGLLLGACIVGLIWTSRPCPKNEFRFTFPTDSRGR